MAQGFVKSLNLLESGNESDVGVLENLAGTGITEDIVLFSGNLRRLSTLEANAYSYDSSTGDLVVTREGRVAFSNRTRVFNGSTEYVVFSSNGLDRFRVRLATSTSTNDDDNSVEITGDITRSNAVTTDNIINMSVDRRPTVSENAVSIDDDSGDVGGSDGGVFNSTSIAANYGYANEAIGLYYYRLSNIPVTYQESVFSKRVTISGGLRITNDSNQDVTQSTAPGIFIVSADGNKIRAFSDTSNPWTPSGTFLETDSSRIAVGRLVLNNPNFVGLSTNSESGSTNDYTHKMKVEIDGEPYYLLLKS